MRWTVFRRACVRAEPEGGLSWTVCPPHAELRPGFWLPRRPRVAASFSSGSCGAGRRRRQSPGHTGRRSGAGGGGDRPGRCGRRQRRYRRRSEGPGRRGDVDLCHSCGAEQHRRGQRGLRQAVVAGHGRRAGRGGRGGGAAAGVRQALPDHRHPGACPGDRPGRRHRLALAGPRGAGAAVPTVAYLATHIVPTGGLDAWDAPNPSRPPVDRLDPRLDLQVTERSGDWAHILCSNEWAAWVDGRALRELSR